MKAYARAHEIAVAEHPDAVIGAGCELGIVVAYGRLIRPNVLAELPLVNVHFSLLPRWRGAAPVERAILAGDEETGVCIMGLEEGLDTGPVYARGVTKIAEHERLEELRSRLGEIGDRLLLERLAFGREGFSDPAPQVGEATYAEKITVSDLKIDTLGAAIAAERQSRVGRAWSTFRGQRLLVHEAIVADDRPEGPPGELVGDLLLMGEGALRLMIVQPEGRARMAAKAWIAGARPTPGESLGG